MRAIKDGSAHDAWVKDDSFPGNSPGTHHSLAGSVDENDSRRADWRVTVFHRPGE
jgi:hypothetical protein